MATTALAPAGLRTRSPLLQVDGVVVNFGARRALDCIDLVVNAGEVVALAGENGAGKTTLVRCVAGDIAPDAGHIFVEGEPIPANLGAVAHSGVAVVWQDLALCDNLDIAANLLLGRERRSLMLSDAKFHDAAARLLDELNIALPRMTELVGSLSGGQRQLLAIARAMRDRPRLLILDEPTGALGVSESAQVEEFTANLRRQGATILLVSHDIDQLFRLADRIVVLRHGRVVAEVDPAESHPEEVVALISGQDSDASARRQLSRLHRLADQLTSADRSSSLSLILSALGAALTADQLCIHLVEGDRLELSASLGLSTPLVDAWRGLGFGAAGGPVGIAAATEAAVSDVDVRTSPAWASFADVAMLDGIGSSWSVPVFGSAGVLGVITVFRPGVGRPAHDELDLVTVYAGYAANAVERDRLLTQLTVRNRVLETIREVLETLAGPKSLVDGNGLVVALGALHAGLQADEVGLLMRREDGSVACLALVGDQRAPGNEEPLAFVARAVLADARRDGAAQVVSRDAGLYIAVSFPTPDEPAVLVSRCRLDVAPPDDTALMADAANCVRLAFERAASERAHQEATTLRRSQHLQRDFLLRLSHELRTPLTAIRGYASSLMQRDVTWDVDSQERFLSRIAAESTRLGRLVDDLLDFSAIESNILRLQPDWCDLALVLDAARACLPPDGADRVTVRCPPGMPPVWADHDRLEQVFVNLMDNALRHNGPHTSVDICVATGAGRPGQVVIAVSDDGDGVPAEMADAPFVPHRARRGRGAGAGLGLSIAKGIVEAHGGRITLDATPPGTRFVIRLPIEAGVIAVEDAADA